MNEINIEEYILWKHIITSQFYMIFSPLKSFALSNASLDLKLSRSLISQFCLDNSVVGLLSFQHTTLATAQSVDGFDIGKWLSVLDNDSRD